MLWEKTLETYIPTPTRGLLRSFGEAVKQPVAQVGTKSKGGQFAYETLWYDGIECVAEVQE